MRDKNTHRKFLVPGRPTLCVMIKSRVTADIIRDIKLAIEEGCDAFGLQIESMSPECKTKSDFSDIFDAMEDKPAYVTDYTRGGTKSAADDEYLAEEMILALECGGDLIDIRGDMFYPTPGEMTYNPLAVEKQIRFIEEIHNQGGEALMSSHVMKFIKTDEVLEIAREQRRRGADIAKIVTAANTESELSENLRTSTYLKDKLGIPSLFLCGGSACRKHRLLGPTIGSDIYLVVQESVNSAEAQPKLKDAKRLLLMMNYENIPGEENI